jgi:hypothetical protein
MRGVYYNPSEAWHFWRGVGTKNFQGAVTFGGGSEPLLSTARRLQFCLVFLVLALLFS